MSAELIRALEPAGSLSRGGGGGGGGGALHEGMKVEARYRGKARYYPGIIKRENRDGTFDVDYGNDFFRYSHSFHYAKHHRNFVYLGLFLYSGQMTARKRCL